jgi:hypothetical protein
VGRSRHDGDADALEEVVHSARIGADSPSSSVTVERPGFVSVIMGCFPVCPVVGRAMFGRGAFFSLPVGSSGYGLLRLYAHSSYSVQRAGTGGDVTSKPAGGSSGTARRSLRTTA